MANQFGDQILFGPFRLDLLGQRLLNGDREVGLRPKSLEVLGHLALHPMQIVSVNELLDSIWSDVSVTPQSVTNVIYELRAALAAGGDPGWIRTVPRRGYRFTAPVRVEGGTAHPQATEAVSPSPTTELDLEVLGDSPNIFVGRQNEIAALTRCWQQSQRGAIKLVFVAGEPGIGKTALVTQFVKVLGSRVLGVRAPPPPNAVTPNTLTPFLLARGRCLPQEQEAEPYMPVLEALGQLAHDAAVVETMCRHAPTWLVQLPWLLAESERDSLRESLAGMATQRMLREGGRLFVELARRTPVILILEDVHWADHATIDLLRALATSPTAAPLLLIATYRSRELAVHDHPLREALGELLSRTATVARLNLDALPPLAIREYLDRRFERPAWAAELASFLNDKSGGNALFLQAMADYLCERGALVHEEQGWQSKIPLVDLDVGIPESLRELIHAQLRRIDFEQMRLLEAAAAAGTDFSALEVAAALDDGEDAVEERCQRIVESGHFIARAGEVSWPDGAVTDRYRFTHALYQQALTEQTPATRQRALHARIGARLEQAFGTRAGEIAPRLAAHFGLARDVARQARYLEQSVQLAIGRYAYREALSYVDRTLEVLARLPEGAERDARTMNWHLEHANLANAIHGWAVGYESYQRALDLAQAQGDVLIEFRAHMGLALTALGPSHPSTEAPAHGRELLAIVERGHPELAAAAHAYNSIVCCARGALGDALTHTEAAQRALPNAAPNIPRSSDLAAVVEGMYASCLAPLGRLDEARRHRAAVARSTYPNRARISRHVAACALDALVAGDTTDAVELAERTLTVANECGFDETARVAAIVREIALAADPAYPLDGLNTLVEQWDPARDIWYVAPLLAHLADLHRRRYQIEPARACIAQAFTLHHGRFAEEQFAEELWRIKGEIEADATAQRGDGDHADAERCLRRSLEIAQQRGTKLFELRTATALVRLLGDEPSRGALRRVYATFTEGFDSTDLRTAAELM